MPFRPDSPTKSSTSSTDTPGSIYRQASFRRQTSSRKDNGMSPPLPEVNQHPTVLLTTFDLLTTSQLLATFLSLALCIASTSHTSHLAFSLNRARIPTMTTPLQNFDPDSPLLVVQGTLTLGKIMLLHRPYCARAHLARLY
jgi:hypothetical protein